MSYDCISWSYVRLTIIWWVWAGGRCLSRLSAQNWNLDKVINLAMLVQLPNLYLILKSSKINGNSSNQSFVGSWRKKNGKKITQLKWPNTKNQKTDERNNIEHAIFFSQSVKLWCLEGSDKTVLLWSNISVSSVVEI